MRECFSNMASAVLSETSLSLSENPAALQKASIRLDPLAES